MSTYFFSEEDFAHARRLWFVAGWFAGLFVAAAILLAFIWLKQPPIFIGAPQIVKQTDAETIARIPTLRGGQRLDCTLAIDHKHRSWSLSC